MKGCGWATGGATPCILFTDKITYPYCMACDADLCNISPKMLVSVATSILMAIVLKIVN